MFDILAVGVLLGGASLYLLKQAFGRRPRVATDSTTCGCGGPASACQTARKAGT